METLIAYILQVNIALVIFYLLYILFMKKDTFFAFRRYYFLSAIVFSFMYPLVAIPALGNMISFEKQVEYTAQVLVEEPTFAVVVDDEALVAEPVKPIEIPWGKIFLYALSAGIVFFLIRFVWQLTGIFYIKHKSTRRNIHGFRVFNLERDMTPFSFFRWIFIHIDSHSDAELKQILLHEQTHARQWHSADVLLAEFLCIFFWWNPTVWLIKREIAINLEYLADNDVIRQGVNCRDYQYHLLRLTYNQAPAQLVNNFNVSPLKQRIMMMNKTKSPARKLAKYLAILPMVLLLITANSVYAQDKKGSDILIEADKLPRFPGGNDAFMRYLADGIKYPALAQENNEQGRVIANFVVEKDGSISNIKVIRGVTPRLNAEAVRLLTSMPNWQPGEHKNQPARVRFTLPIVFRLQGDNVGTNSTPPMPPSPDADEKGKMLDEVVVVAYSGGRTPIPASGDANSNELFVVVENQPEFPGGFEALNKFINDSLRYPAVAKENGIQGRVITNFVVEKDGSVQEIQIVRGVDPALDKEAIRLIGSMPKWTPGTQRGNKVRVRYTLPVVFRLSENNAKENRNETPQTPVTEEIFVVVENQPEFPGGSGAMMKFLADNIRYPKEAHEKGTQGRVISNFVVMKDGSIGDVQIVRGVDPLLDAEAVRVISSMPAWKPGKQRGQAVNVRYTLPVVFSLNKKEPNVEVEKLQESGGPLSVTAQTRPNVSFPGGDNAFMKYVSDHVKYPVIAQEQKVQGLINTSFNVDNNGKISNIKIESGDNALLNKEALRVIEAMPQWVKDQSVLVSGKVADPNGNPLHGASVILKGTSNGTVSDANGNFQLTVPSKEGVLAVSFVGFKLTEVSVSNLKAASGNRQVKLPFVFRLQGDNVEEYKGPTPHNAVIIVGYGD